MALFRNKLFIIFTFIFSIVLFVALIEPRIANSTNGDLSDKKIIALLFENLDVKLSDARFCENAGTDFTDKTMSDYLAGFWLYHAQKTGQNWIEISSKTVSDKSYLATVMIYRKQGEENWGWGVSFEIDKLGFAVNRKSFSCLGAG